MPPSLEEFRVAPAGPGGAGLELRRAADGGFELILRIGSARAGRVLVADPALAALGRFLEMAGPRASLRLRTRSGGPLLAAFNAAGACSLIFAAQEGRRTPVELSGSDAAALGRWLALATRPSTDSPAVREAMADFDSFVSTSLRLERLERFRSKENPQ